MITVLDPVTRRLRENSISFVFCSPSWMVSLPLLNWSLPTTEAILVIVNLEEINSSSPTQQSPTATMESWKLHNTEDGNSSKNEDELGVSTETVLRPPVFELTEGDIYVSDETLFTSAKDFSDLGLQPSLLHGIISMGYHKPSKIQERALPCIFSDPPKNMIAQSQSGTGKTIAFTIGMLQKTNARLQELQTICLAPTRELARQIYDTVTRMGQYMGLHQLLVVKDAQIPWNARHAQIVIGTPGKVMDCMQRGILSGTNCKVFVIDEADNMLADLSCKETLTAHVMAVRRQMPPSCQILLFSATWTDTVVEFANCVAPDPVCTIRLTKEELTLQGIRQLYINCRDEEHKLEVLMALYGLLTVGQSIVFVDTRVKAEYIVREMLREGHTVAFLHGGLVTDERDWCMRSFREGKCKVLVATNVLARGIDVRSTNLIINYDLPLVSDRDELVVDTETYLHRIGRTGRFGGAGVSICFVHDRRSFMDVMRLQDYFKRPIMRVSADSFENLEIMLKKAVGRI